MSRDIDMEDSSSNINSGYKAENSERYTIQREEKINDEIMVDSDEESKDLQKEQQFLTEQHNEPERETSSNLVIRSKKKSLRNLEICEKEGRDPNEESYEEIEKKNSQEK